MSGDWDLVGGNPSPGDPSWLNQQVVQLQTIADDAADCSSQLTAIADRWSTADWSGEAADAFLVHLSHGVIPDLKKLHDSYGIASSALRRYASSMESLQAEAAGVLAQAEQAAAEQLRAENDLRTANGQLQAANSTIAEATREISGTETTIQHQMNAANISVGTKQAVTGLMSWLVSAGSSASAQAASEVTAHLQVEPGGAAIQPVVHAAVFALGAAAEMRILAQREAEAASTAVGVASQSAGNASDALAGARARISTIRAEFQEAVGAAGRALRAASAAGIQNVGVLDRFIRRVDTDVGALTYASGKLVSDLDAATHGNFTGLERDGKAMLIEGAALAHEAAGVVHAAAAEVDKVTTELAPVLTVIGVAAKILTFVLPPPADAIAAGIAFGTMVLPGLISTAAKATEVASDELAVASDETSLAMGVGSEAELESDAEQGLGDGVGLLESAGNAALNGAIPDAGDALGGVLPETTTLVPTLVKATVTTGVSQVEGQVEGDLEGAAESDAVAHADSLLPPSARVSTSVSS